MGLFEIASILITLAALFSYINFKFIRLPTTIGVMLISVAASLCIMALGGGRHPFLAHTARLVAGIDFNELLMHGMLAFLLFAGSLHLDLGDLGREWDIISVLSLAGTICSTFIVGGLSWLIFGWLGLAVPIVWCLLLGALISPTDPIAVLGIMRKVGAPKALETQLAGESLFNDGVGVVIFLATLGVATAQQPVSWPHLLLMLLKQVAGGAAVGLAAGMLFYRLLKSVDNYQVEVLLTLALATGGYTTAEAMHVSAPIAAVVSGLFIGNHGRSFAMSETTRVHLDSFWELLDEVLNTLLFLVIGLQLLVMPFSWKFVCAGLATIGVVLLARWASVAGMVTLLRLRRPFKRGTITVLTWGGLRGGLSVAMALSLPLASVHRELILIATYCVVVFSIFVQGLSSAAVIRRTTGALPHADNDFDAA